MLEKQEEGRNYSRVERSYGAFRRSIQLPAEIVPDKIDATFKKGVLTVHVPKSPEAQKSVKRIAVKSEKGS